MSNILLLLAIVVLCRCASSQQQQGYDNYNQFAENFNYDGGVADFSGSAQNEEFNYGQYDNEYYGDASNDFLGASNAYDGDYFGNVFGNNASNAGDNDYLGGKNLISNAEIFSSDLLASETENTANLLTNDSDDISVDPLPTAPDQIDTSNQFAQPETAPHELSETSGHSSQPESSVEHLASDLVPATSELWWVGYDFNRRQKLLKIQILTNGTPAFDFIQERNQKDQPELVVRFYGTTLRKKIARDIDASEFSSPVAYIRMREDSVSNAVDVVLTMRDQAKPLMYARNGNVQLTFALNDKYLGRTLRGAVASYEAEDLTNAEVLPDIVVGSDLPKSAQLAKAYIPDPVGKVFDHEARTGSKNVVPLPAREVETRIDRQGLPVEDFSTKASHAKPDSGSTRASSPENEIAPIPAVPIDELEGKYDDLEPGLLEDPELEEDFHESLLEDESVYKVNSFSWFGVAQDDFALDSTLGEYSSPQLNDGFQGGAIDSPTVTDDGVLNFDNVQPIDTAAQSDISASPDAFSMQAATAADTVMAETLSLDEVGSSFTAADIVGSDSEVVAEDFSGKPVVLEFFDAPLGQVLKAFADQIGTNFIYPPSLGQNTKVTIKLKNVPWDAALNALLETYGLGMARIADNIVRIDNLNNMNKYISDRQQAKNIKMLSQPSKILVIRLSNSEARNIEQQIRRFIPQSLNRSINISSDDQTNTIYLEAPPPMLAKVKTLVERLDVAVPQVEIMSRLVEVSRSAQNFLGVSWAGAFNYDANRGLGFGSLNIPNSFGSTYSVDPGVNRTSTVGSSTFNIGSINNLIDLNLRLKMEEAKGTAEVLQSSRIMVKDRSQANINAGTKAYIRTLQQVEAGQVVNQQSGSAVGASGMGAGNITEVDIDLSLSVTPRVTNDGHVEMQLALRSATPASSGLPGATLTVNNRELNTLLRKKSGETAVIGGIYDTKKIEQESGIPFFSSLPIIGALFRSKTTSQSQTEMMMLITPRIQTDVEDAVATGESAPPAYTGESNLSFNGNYNGAYNNNIYNYGAADSDSGYEYNTYDNNEGYGVDNTYDSGNIYGNGSLQGNVNQSTYEYDNTYGNY